MTLLHWALYGLAAAAGFALVAYLYLRREPPGCGGALLIILRGSALALLLLLLFDPEVPAPGLAAGRGRTVVLLDASLSMRLPAGPATDSSRWARALAAVRGAEAREVLLFGDDVRAADADSLAALAPSQPASRLLPALTAAAEAGAERAMVVTDARIGDAAAVRRRLPELGLEVDVRSVARPAVNHALAQVEAPARAEAGDPLEIRVGVRSTAAAGDTVTVLVRRADRVLARAEVTAPAPGRVSTATLRFSPEPPPADTSNLVRYDIALRPGGAAAADDERSVYIRVSDEPTGITLVSFRPGWEPRFLAPALERALGLPVRGFLRVDTARYVRMGAGLKAGVAADAGEVRRALEAADLAVVHGLSESTPGWAHELISETRRALIFPAGDGSVLDAPFSFGAPVEADWYVAPEVPSSPVAGQFAPIASADLPPLTSLRPVERTSAAWAPLLARRARSGPTRPVALARAGDGRRRVVVLGSGFWRWALRGGAAGQAYRRLWSALAGWLMKDRPVAGAPIRPADRTAPRGRPLRWLVPGLTADSLALRVTAAGGDVALDTTVAVGTDAEAVTRALAPGHYRYAARAFADGTVVARAEGPLTVERYSSDFAIAPASLDELERHAGSETGATDSAGRPLHTAPWPYLLLVGLLSADWILRRRRGLR